MMTLTQTVARRQPAHLQRRPKVVPFVFKELRERGLDPVKGLDDPRLEYPELMLLDGFHWEPLEGGSCYVSRCEEDERYFQTVEFRADDSRVITSATPARKHIVTQRADGTFIERHR